MSENPYLFSVHFCPCSSALFYLCSRLFGDTCYMPRQTYSALLFTIPCCYSVLPHFFFMSCSHLISLLCSNLLWDTIFRIATPCTHQILCGQHDRVCDVVYFDHHQHSGSLFTHHGLQTDNRSRTLFAGLRISARGYLPTR